MSTVNQYCYEFPRPSIASDCVIVNEKNEILLIQRKNPPDAGKWALPGGFMEIDETTESAASRELFEETGVNVPAHQLKLITVFSAVNRDQRTRIVSVSYFARVENAKLHPVAGDDASLVAWHDLNFLPDMAFDHSGIVQCAMERYGSR